jgi:hypothetical protein
MTDGHTGSAAGVATPDDANDLATKLCGKPVEECTSCKWRSGNRPERPCVKCGGPVIQRPCRKWRVPGTSACVHHGSGSKVAKAAGRRRIARGKAAKTLRDVEVVPIGDPLEELVNLASEARALQQWFADRVAELAEEDKTGEAAEALKLYTSAINDVGRLLERCARLGIEGKRTDALVAQGQLIAQVVRGALDAVFGALVAAAVDGRLEVDMVVRVQHEQVPAIIRAQLAEAAGELGTGE